jgi:hypothetical protein
LLLVEQPARTCSVSPDKIKSAGQVVQEADLIVRARAVRFLPPASIDDPRERRFLKIVTTLTQAPPNPDEVRRARQEHPGALAESYGAVELEVLEVLTGTLAQVGSKRRVVGRVVEYQGRNTGEVPYETARPGAGGGCLALDYALGREYLLMFANESLDWAPLAPVNEEVAGPNDKWVTWVRAEVKRRPRTKPRAGSVETKDKVNDIRQRLRDEQDREKRVRAERQLQGPFQ